MRGVADWIVWPWRKRILLAVGRPGVTAAFSRNDKPERRIRDYVDPRHRCAPTVCEPNGVFARLTVEATAAVVEVKRPPLRDRRLRGRVFGTKPMCAARSGSRSRRGIGGICPFGSLVKPVARSVENDACCGSESVAQSARNFI